MKKFTFKLAQLGKIRKEHESAAMLRLAVAQTDLAREEKTLTRLAGSITESNSQLASLISGCASAGALAASDAFRCSTLSAARRQRMRVKMASGTVAEKQEEFQAAHRKAEAIRRLHQARLEEHKRECFKMEQREQDEYAALAAPR